MNPLLLLMDGTVNAAGQKVPVLVGSFPLDMDDETLTCLTFTDVTTQKAQDREIARLSNVQRERLVLESKTSLLIVRGVASAEVESLELSSAPSPA